MEEYRDTYRQILTILEKYGKHKDNVQNSFISLKLNTIETIVFNRINGALIKTIKGESEKTYWQDAEHINCSLTELKALLLQLELKFDVK